MHSDDFEVQGLVVDTITYQGTWERIDPPFSGDEIEQFILPYYERCLREDREGEWFATRYGAMQNVLEWYRAVPQHADVNEQTFLLHMKDWLAALYLKGDEGIRDAIVCGALEHILEQHRWRGFFKDWCEDPVLREAYDRAIKWAVEHEELTS